MKFTSLKELIDSAVKKEVSLGYLVKEREAENQEIELNLLEERMASYWQVMQESIAKGLNEPQKSMGGLLYKEGQKLNSHVKERKTLAGEWINLAAARALAVAEVNASMGKIIAAPTAGSCGIIPGVLLTVQERVAAKDKEVVDALFTCSGIGIIIAQRASISGAEGGCQAECGSAAAMAAAAAVELAGGSPVQAGEAAALALKSMLGLVCDPVAGLVEVPCAKRNAISASIALTAADMALAGIVSKIPVDEVIAAMGEVGKCIPESLRETAEGGLAAQPTAQKILEKFKCNA